VDLHLHRVHFLVINKKSFITSAISMYICFSTVENGGGVGMKIVARVKGWG